MKQFQLWWASLQQREQQLLTGAGVVVVIALFYGLIWQPLHQARIDQQLAAKGAAEQLQWLQSQLPKLGNTAVSPKTQGSLTDVVSQTAGRYQVQVSRMQPQNDQLQLSLEDLPFDQLLRWLHELQYQQGVTLVQLNIARSDVPGQVRVRRMVLE